MIKEANGGQWIAFEVAPVQVDAGNCERLISGEFVAADAPVLADILAIPCFDDAIGVGGYCFFESSEYNIGPFKSA